MKVLFVALSFFVSFYQGTAWAGSGVAILSSHLTGELNALLAVAKQFDSAPKLVHSEQLELLEEVPEIIFHALGNPDEIDALVEFKKQHRAVKIVNFGDPMKSRGSFDMIVASGHMQIEPHVADIVADGVPSLKSSSEISHQVEKFSSIFESSERPVITVLVGGNAKASVFTPAHAELLAKQLNKLKAIYNATLLITNSRRTSDEVVETLLSNLKFDSSDRFFDIKKSRMKVGDSFVDFPENPFDAMLGRGHYVVVTGDSMSMISDSLHLGKPTYIFAAQGSLEDRHRAFIIKQANKGRLKPLSNTLSFYEYEPLNTAREIAIQLDKKMSLRMTHWCVNIFN